MRRLKVLAVALALAVGAAGCGGSGHQRVKPIDITGTRALSLPAVARRPSLGPGPGQADVAFTDARRGFVLDSDAIQRTTDGGRSWVTVWRRRGFELEAIAAAGQTILATGDTRFRDVVVRSTDGGATWAVLRPAVPGPAAGYWFALRPRLISRSLVFMVLNDDIYNPPLPGRLGGALLRSTDGGLLWSASRLPGHDVYATGGLAFTGPARGFATGFGGYGSGPCASRIFATTTAGAHWTPVPGTCLRAPLESLSFPRASVGYAAAAPTDLAAAPTPLTLLVSTDGGARWSRRFGSMRASGNPPPVGSFAQIDFPDSSDGYALLGGCPMGANGLCAGTLWTTDDGGLSWRDANQVGTDLSVVGRHDAWLVAAPAYTNPPEPNGDFLSSSTDGGRSWTVHGRSSALALTSLLASGSRLYARTSAGELESEDGGVHWRGGNEPAPRGAADVAFSDDRHGLALQNRGSVAPACPSRSRPLPHSVSRLEKPPSAAVLVTSTGPNAWHAVSTVPLNADAVAYTGDTAVVLGTGCGTPNDEGFPGEEVAISRNGGHSWRVRAIPGSPFPCTPGLADGTVAILCSTNAGFELLVSQDAGHTWTAYKKAGYQPQNLGLAAASHRLWLSGPPGALWTSSDGGASWISERLAFSP